MGVSMQIRALPLQCRLRVHFQTSAVLLDRWKGEQTDPKWLGSHSRKSFSTLKWFVHVEVGPQKHVN